MRTAGHPDRIAASEPEPVLFRRPSVLPTRRAVLHVQAAGDPAVPADVTAWFTERGFHFVAVGLRLPAAWASGRRTGTRPGEERFAEAFADLDAACRLLREAEDMEYVIITAQDKGALAAALWADRAGRCSRASRPSASAASSSTPSASAPPGLAADALVLMTPAFAAWPGLELSISCPMLVLTGGHDAPPGRTRPALRTRRPRAAAPPHLGSHVTWLQLADQNGVAGGREVFFDELGRWLGAYMYGVRDRLL